MRKFHILVFSRGVVALFFATACVSTPQYEQVSSAVEVEREAHRRTHVELETAEQRLARIEGKFEESQGSLSAKESQQAELDLKQTTSDRELRAARELAEDLQTELVRVRKALDAASDSNKDLEAENKKLTLALERAERSQGATEEKQVTRPEAEPALDEESDPAPKKQARRAPTDGDDEPPAALSDGG